MNWLRRVIVAISQRPPDPASVVPMDRDQAHLLERADGLLAHPAIQRLENVRQAELRASFARAQRRLAGRV